MNMKFIVGLVGLVFPVMEAGFIDPAALRQFRQLEAQCKKSLQINTSERTSSVAMSYLFKGEAPKDRNGKCIAKCMLEEAKLVHFDGLKYYVHEGLHESPVAQELRDKIERRVEICLYNVPVNPDGCEMGASLLSCLLEDYRRQAAELHRLLGGIR